MSKKNSAAKWREYPLNRLPIPNYIVVEYLTPTGELEPVTLTEHSVSDYSKTLKWRSKGRILMTVTAIYKGTTYRFTVKTTSWLNNRKSGYNRIVTFTETNHNAHQPAITDIPVYMMYSIMKLRAQERDHGKLHR